MKKTLLTGLAIAAVFAFASTAGAVTCTVDQHPAATLLVPWFQVSVNASGDVIGTGIGARDTLVTIGNASAAPMIAHVNVFNEHSELVLDFNIALTGFDIQSFAMSSIITGTLPQTGWFNTSGVLQDACQRNPASRTYSQSPTGIGFIRFRPPAPTDSNDNVLATTLYPVPAWTKSSAFYMQVLDSLDDTFDTNTCPNFDGVDGILAGLEHGYLVIDHANYCNLSNPSQDLYYYNDAIGNENNMFGDIIFTSGEGLPTYAMSTVNLEADSSFGFGQSDTQRFRSFYARYWSPSAEFPGGFNPANCTGIDPVTNICLAANWDTGFGDLREPLGLTYAARWFDTSSPFITTNYRVWRAGFGSLTDLLGPVTSSGPKCTDTEPVVTLSFYDEDENTVTQGVCPSPCSSPSFNFPLETQQTNISEFSHPTAPAGWVAMNFVNQSGGGTAMDQAWADFSFEGSAAFLSILVPGTQLDISTCNPNLVFSPAAPTAGNPAILFNDPFFSDIPTGVGP